MKYLLEGISRAKSLKCLRLSHLQINDSVLVGELTKSLRMLPELCELNLSYQGFLPQQLNDIMFTIAEHYPRLQMLNLSGNPLPTKDNKYSQSFMDNLIRFIENEENTKLVDLDLSTMNLQSSVERLTWPVAKSKTIQSLHLSNNEIPNNVLTDLLMVFGIRKDKS